MKILAKFYNSLRDNTIINQVFIDSEVVIEKDLLTFGLANFTMPLISGIEEFTICELYEVGITGNDTKLFRGFISNVEPIWKQFGQVKITVSSEKAVFDRRFMIENQKSYEVNQKGALPTYPTGYVGLRVLNGSNIATITGIIFPEPPGTTILREWEGTRLVDTSYIYVSDDNEMRKYEGTGVPTTLGTATGLDIKIVLDDIVSDYNTLYGENRTVEVDFTAEIMINKSLGDNFFSVIDELAQQNNAVRDIEDGVVKFKHLLGIDRTIIGEKYEEIIFNGTQPSNSNISNISVVGDALRTNLLVMKYTDYNKKLISNYTSKLYNVAFETFRDGDSTLKGQAWLDRMDNQQRTYKVDVEANTIVADIGDKIKLKVENTNEYFDYDGDVLVTKKTIVYNKGKQETYEFQQFNTTPFTNTNRARNITKAVKYSQL